MNRCPLEPPGVVVEAEFVGEGIDEELGMPISFYECPNGHTWYKPSQAWLVRTFAYAEQAAAVGERRIGLG